MKLALKKEKLHDEAHENTEEQLWPSRNQHKQKPVSFYNPWNCPAPLLSSSPDGLGHFFQLCSTPGHSPALLNTSRLARRVRACGGLREPAGWVRAETSPHKTSRVADVLLMLFMAVIIRLCFPCSLQSWRSECAMWPNMWNKRWATSHLLWKPQQCCKCSLLLGGVWRLHSRYCGCEATGWVGKPHGRTTFVSHLFCALLSHGELVLAEDLSWCSLWRHSPLKFLPALLSASLD